MSMSESFTGRDYEQKVNTDKLNQIITAVENFDEADIPKLRDALENVSDNIVNDLKTNEKFLGYLINLLNSRSLTDDEIKNSLEALAKQLWLSNFSWSWEKPSNDSEQTSDNLTQLQINWKLDEIEKKDNSAPRFWKGIVISEGENDEGIDEDLKLYKTKEKLENLKNGIDSLSWEKTAELTNISNYIERILNVIDDPSVANVKILQQFISENIDNLWEWFNKNDFDKANKKGSEFDWIFGKSTLKYLNGLVSKFEEYINGIDNSSWANESLTGVAPTGGWSEVSEVNGAKSGEWENVPSWPLEINGSKYPYYKDFPVKLDWATFYSNIPLVVWEGSEQQVDYVQYTNGGEIKCFMTMENDPGVRYTVTLDAKWNLCPIAENGNEKVLLKNIQSCCNYLKEKMPENLPGNPVISWNDSKQDYAITSFGETMTIEPMTLDGWWISQDLSKCLLLLNFANMLTGANGIHDAKSWNYLNFENNNPDLKMDGTNVYIKLKKNQTWWDKWKWGEWYPIPKSYFWLTDDELKKFVKYNNWEDWNDNWDKNKNNQYTKISVIRWKTEAAGAFVGSMNFSGVTMGTNVEVSSENDLVIDETRILELDLAKMEDSELNIVRNTFAIPDGVVVYKTKEEGKRWYYYMSWETLTCVWFEEKNSEWKKWDVEGSNGEYAYTERVNVCETWAKKLDELLKAQLTELDEQEKEKLSIYMAGGNYMFKNGSLAFSINEEDNILTEVKNFWELKDYNPSVEEKLKIVYLASKYVPWTFALAEGENGWNIVCDTWTESKTIDNNVLSGYGMKVDETAKKAFINYLNTVSSRCNAIN